MGDPIKIRATLHGEITEIRLLLQHPMETGQRKDPATGRNIAAHFIQNFTLSANGKPLVEGQLNTSVARNPLFSFRARGLKIGDKVTVGWTDTRNDQRNDETAVVAA